MNNLDSLDLPSLIFTAVRVIREEMNGSGQTSPLSMAQYKILAVIYEKQSPTMKEIAESLFITGPSATTAIDHLVKEGQLERTSDQTDGRITRLQLTEKGKTIFTGYQDEVKKRIDKILESLTDQEKIEFANILSKITNSHHR